MAYKNRRIPRPPGPFDGQSTSHLRDILVRSARVQRNWPPFVRSPRPTSHAILKSARQHLSVIHGRWLITGDSPLLLSYDTCSSNPDWTAIPQIFYRPHLTANFFHCFSIIAEDGQELLFAVSDTLIGTARRKLNLFTIDIDPSHGPFISAQVFALDIRPAYSGVWAVTTGPRFLVISAKGLEHEDPPIILDVKTFQRFHIVIPMLPQSPLGIFTSFISTSSHLLVARLLCESETLLQVFPLNQAHSEWSVDGIRVLRPSHVMRTPDLGFRTWHILRGPTYQVFTGRTRITLMLTVVGRTSATSGVVSLNVVHLTLDTDGNISFTSEMLWELPRDAAVLADSSHDGCIRGLVYSRGGAYLMPFMIDDQDKDGATCLPCCNLADISLPFRKAIFDGHRGVLCLVVAAERGWRVEVTRFA